MMATPLLVAQMSDLHYANETLVEVDRCFWFAVEHAIANGVQCAVISGDSTDHRLDVHSPAFVALAKRIRQLSDHCPVLMLQGTFSHEPQGTLDIFRLINGAHPVYVADKICQVALVNGAWVESTGYAFTAEDLAEFTGVSGCQAIFTCLPTVNKAVVAASVGTSAAAEEVGNLIDQLLTSYASINALAHQFDIPTIGVTHGTVHGCITEHGVPMMGLDHEFGTGSLFAAQCASWMVGHIHMHQSWELDGRRIAYPGSIARLHYGEEGAKGYLLWAVSPVCSDLRLIETPARKMVHLEFSGAPDLDQIKDVAEQSKDAFVRVRWTIDEEQSSAADRAAILDILSGAAEVKLEARKIPIVRTRAEGINNKSSLEDKLNQWCDVSCINPDGLSERMSKLLSMTPEEIVETI